MKKALFVLLVCASAPAFAQSPSPSVAATPAPTAGASPSRIMPPGGIHSISPEDRQALMSASKKADTDPAVQDAKQKVQDAMKGVRNLMLTKDPTLAPLLDKLEASAAGPAAPGSTPYRLSPDERTKLMAARSAVQDSPEAKALNDAVVAYRDAHRKVMETDPTVAAILAKLRPASAVHMDPKPAASPAAPVASPAPAAN